MRRTRALFLLIAAAAPAAPAWSAEPGSTGGTLGKKNKSVSGAAPAAPAPAPPAAPSTTGPRETAASSIRGTWKTVGENEHIIFSGVSGGSVSASYAPNSGRIFGQLRGRQLSGYWTEAVSRVSCDKERFGTRYWGRLTFTFDPAFKRFTGSWGHCDGPLHTAWDANRIGQ